MSLFGKKKPTKKRTKPITAKLPEKQKATTAQHKSAATAARTTTSTTKTTANKNKATTRSIAASATKTTASRKAQTKPVKKTKTFPDIFPFWARFKKNKKRTTLVIDDDVAMDKRSKKTEDAFVHREATHTSRKDYEEITPNPDRTDCEPMYLKRPRKHPKRMFEPHNKDLSIPDHLKERYSKK